MDSRREAQVQVPKLFDGTKGAGHKLLNKVQQLISMLAGHAIAAHKDAEPKCCYFASNELQGLFLTEDFTGLIRQQLTERYHSGENIVSEFLPIADSPSHLISDQRKRTDTYVQRMPTLQHLAQEIKVRFPELSLCICILAPTPTRSSPTALLQLG